MHGMIAWFARNSVAANLLMAFIVVSGLIGAFNVRAETYPEFSLDMVDIQVPYLGAAPEEVEAAVCIRIEEAIQSIEGIKRITSTAAEGMGSVTVEVEPGGNTRKVLDDIKSAVDTIDTFPEQTEKPIIREMIARNRVIDVAVSGPTDEFTLKRVAERVRDELSAIPANLAGRGDQRTAVRDLDRGVGAGPEAPRPVVRRRRQRGTPIVARSAGRLGPK